MGHLQEVDSEKSLRQHHAFLWGLAQLCLSGSIKATLSMSTQKVLFFLFFHHSLLLNFSSILTNALGV